MTQSKKDLERAAGLQLIQLYRSDPDLKGETVEVLKIRLSIAIEMVSQMSLAVRRWEYIKINFGAFCVHAIPGEGEKRGFGCIERIHVVKQAIPLDTDSFVLALDRCMAGPQLGDEVECT